MDAESLYRVVPRTRSLFNGLCPVVRLCEHRFVLTGRTKGVSGKREGNPKLLDLSENFCYHFGCLTASPRRPANASPATRDRRAWQKRRKDPTLGRCRVPGGLCVARDRFTEEAAGMKILKAITLLAALMCAVQACSQVDTEQYEKKLQAASEQVNQLREELAAARDQLAEQENRNRALTEQVESLKQRLQKPAPRRGGRSGGPEAEARIKLLGARALAEHRAEALGKRLDRLKEDLKQKEEALESIRSEAREKGVEVEELQTRLRSLQEAEGARSAELKQRLDAIRSELEERSKVSNQLRRQVKRNEELVETLNRAVADARQLKEKAEADVERLIEERTRLSEQVEEAQAEIERMQDLAERSRAEISRCTEEVESLRTALIQREEQIAKLRETIESIAAQPQAAPGRDQAAAEAQQPTSEPSTLDMLLRGPQRVEESEPDRSKLY